MPGTFSFKELMVAHFFEDSLEGPLHVHPMMLESVFDLMYEEAKAITDELGLRGEAWPQIWGENKRDDNFKSGVGIIVHRKEQ